MTTDDRLTADQLRAALVSLAAWSGQPFSDEDRTIWRTALRGYRPGELAKALDAWQRTEGGRYRPRPGDLAPYLERPARPQPLPFTASDIPKPTPAERDFGLAALRRIRDETGLKSRLQRPASRPA